MCGIVGYIGEGDVVSVLMEGLRSLEYRGYDSAGIALVNESGDVDVRRAPAVVSADKRKFKQILYNLLSNAVKFTPDGGRVSLAAAMIAANNGDGPLVEVSVQDTGIGISSGDLERIFKTFEQVESSAARQFEGTGLGLALSRSLVQLHGGKIWAESGGQDRGSRFVFTLPVDTGRGQN